MPEAVESRHGIIAEDSVRVCTILPRAMVDEMKTFVNKNRPTLSAVVREFSAVGMEKVKRYGKRTEG